MSERERERGRGEIRDVVSFMNKVNGLRYEWILREEKKEDYLRIYPFFYCSFSSW